MQPLAKLLENIIFARAGDHPAEFFKRKLLVNWPEISGKLSTRMCIERVQQRMVVLGVYDTAWMQELYCMSDLLLAQINKFIGEAYFTELRFRYVNQPKIKLNQVNSGASVTCAKIPAVIKPVIIKLSVQEQATLKKIIDPELRLALKNFLVRCKS
ncbi:MAG TPA: DciA family protein [Candidatus Babeliales bacterium]|nr:DciA family protein [Candidatus Babeliales bacterium]